MTLHLHELHFNLGGVLHQQGRYEEAAEHYRQSLHFSQGLESTGDRALAYHSLGIALSHQGEWEEAIACYQAALTLRPQEGAIYISLGIAHAHRQQIEEAIAVYRVAVSRCPDFCLAHYYLGKAWQVTGNHAEAVSCFWRAHRLNPAELLVLNDLLMSLAELGRWDDMTEPLRAIAALPELRRVLLAYAEHVQADPGNDPVAEARRHCADFLRSLHHADTWKPMLAKALWYWGQVLMSHGRAATLRQAETFYQQAIALQPERADYYDALVRCLALQHRREAAVVVAHWGLRLDPKRSNCLTPLSEDTTAGLSGLSPPLAPACDGLNCSSCLQDIYQAFAPTHLGRGVFRLGVAQPLEHEAPPLAILPQGRAWVAPQHHPWQACHAIAVFDEAGTLQPERCRTYPGQLPGCKTSHLPLVPPDLPPAHRLPGTAALLAGLSAHVYFHWMVDILPRAIALQSVQTEPIDWFIVNSIQKPFQRETLQRLGIPADRVVESDRHPHLEADRLVVPSFVSPLGWPSARTIESVRRFFLPTNPPPSTFPNRIYVTRSGARYRRVLNEAAIVGLLQRVGVVPVDLEQLSVAEQATLFAQATLIVAPHGSGLTNLLFCQPGATVIELMSSNYVRHYYWPISQQRQLLHYTVVSPGLPCFLLRTWMYLNPLAEDLWVDEASLQRALEVALPSDSLSSAPLQQHPSPTVLTPT